MLGLTVYVSLSLSESGPVEYNMMTSLQYAANSGQSLSEECQQSYNSSVLVALNSSGATFKQICDAQSTIITVAYNEGSLQSTYDTNNRLVGYEQFLDGLLVKKKKLFIYFCIVDAY